MPESPVPREIPSRWEHKALYERVKKCLYALPGHFKSQTIIEGVQATDLHTLGGPLGASIETQVVSTLNQMRPLWDPDENYRTFSFIRQSQKFPDVLFQQTSNGQENLIGIELKGWYLLAKESEPNFRFAVTRKACNFSDFLVVVPWALSNILSGSPRVFSPFITQAAYAAEYRNFWWKHIKASDSSREIREPATATIYPRKSDPINDDPASDKGGNFGRFARTGMMDDYKERVLATSLCGIPASEWVQFFRRFQE